MKRLLSVLTTAALCLSSASALAEYDEFSCVTNSSLKLSSLECVTCGITKYYADQGIEMNPSHRWVALLGLMVRENKLTPQGGRGIVRDTEAHEVFVKEVIKRIQVYGVCNEFTVSEMGSRSKNMHDMTAQDWKEFSMFITGDKVPSDDTYDKFAKKLGFKSNNGLFGSDKGPKASLDYLFEGHMENLTLDEKRSLFKEKLNQALEPDYTVAGDKKNKSIEFVRSGDEGKGLKRCLSDIRERYFRKQMSDQETYKMCGVIADSCDIQRGSLDRGLDFCAHRGMGLRPASTTQPPPFSGGGGGRMPPPPRPATSGKGIN
ncbi:hypothetical protein AZI87_14910 [Bdellovibrio bacteriovorus]|uniref:Hydrolase n=1 Tax=Bdellovibrio bacteriovorus TaxID=959 RepID=A0A162FVY3_BDEBC|nr:hypothetical protein [Bdellovibrio bacteriovorus]KYG62589.1 hypothetical protein AZI87_14910 [Bdellovibrio bacteriovorus]